MIILVIIGVFVVVVAFVGLSYVRSSLQGRTLAYIKNEIQRGNNQGAIKHLLKMISKNHLNHKAHKLLGDAYKSIGNKRLAVVEYRLGLRGIQKEPIEYEVELREALAQILIDNKSIQEAIEELILLSKVQEKNQKTYKKLSDLFLQLNNLEKAMAYMRMAIRVDNKNADLYYDLGMMFYNTRRYRDAMQEFHECLGLQSAHPGACYYIGSSHKQLGEYPEALKWLELAEKQREFRTKVHLNQGICYIHLNNLAKAQEKLEAVVESPSPSPDHLRAKLHAQYLLAQIYEDRGDIVNALKYWEAIHKIDSHFKDVPAKLKQYQDLRSSDLIKDYMICSMKEFKNTSINLLKLLRLAVHELKDSSHNEKLIFVCKEEVKMVLGMKVLFRFVIFNRSSQELDDGEMRASLEAAKKYRCTEVIYITTTKISYQATRYIQNRPIKLIMGKELNLLLEQASSSFDDLIN